MTELNSKIPAGPIAEKWDTYKSDMKLVNPNNKRKFKVIVVGTGLAGASIGNLAAYALGMAGLRPRSDAFFASMKGSIAAFHATLDAGRAPVLDGAFGAALVQVCERMDCWFCTEIIER